MKTCQHVRTYWLCFYFLYYKKTWLKNMSGSAFGAEFWSFQTKQRHRIHISLFCYLCGEDRGGGWGVRWGVGGGVRVLFYLQIFSFLILNRHQRERETRAQTKCTSPQWNTLAAAGQQRPWGHSEATVDRSQSGLTHSSHTFTPHPAPPSSQKSQKQAAGAITWHISIQFPLQNVFIFRLMACHFAGAFGQELILESKQIFRGAIFHQVLIFLHSRSLYSLI